MVDMFFLSIWVFTILFLGILLAKFIILKFGRPIKYSFSSFFWFSSLQVSNSSNPNSKQKRIILNYLSIAIILLIFLELGFIGLVLFNDPD